MAKYYKIDTRKLYAQLNKRTEGYAAAVRGILNERIGDIVALCEGLELEEGKVFKFADYEDINPAVSKKLRELYSELYQSVRGNIAQEWKYANSWNDDFVKRMFGRKSIDDNHYAKYFAHNKEAMMQFYARKQDGLDLSQRIWKYVGEAKEELELALDLGIGEGLGAGELSRAVREYLHEPDKLFRRVRNKHGNLVLSKNAKAYNPGRGYYRSSYKNAERLTRTETNMAYRTCDITRWQQMDFILGYEIKRSNNPFFCPVCESLAGRYPKTFVFKGWHPNCRCFLVPILCTEEELGQLTEMILRGEDTANFTPAGVIDEVPEEYSDWINTNTDSILRAKSLPFFIRDNYVNGDINKGFKWVQEYKNEAGITPFGKLLGKSDIDVDSFTKMQTITNAQFEESSNFVTGDDKYKLSATAPSNNTMQFEQAGKLRDKKLLEELLDDSEFGDDNSWMYFNDELLEELQKVSTQKRFLSTADSKFVFSLNDASLAAIEGDSLVFSGSRYVGTNYSQIVRQSLKDGAIANEQGAVCILNAPKGKRYLQTMIGEEQAAMFMPNTQLKVVSSEVKTITHAGKSIQVKHYNLELVDDGSEYINGLVETKAKIKAGVAAHKEAIKEAKEVLNSASEWDGVFGVDTSKLLSLTGNGNASDILAEAKALTQAIVKAKEEAVKLYENTPTMWGLKQEFGEQAAEAFMSNWQKHMAKKGTVYATDELFLEKVLKKELYYAELNPDKYPTSKKLIYYLKKEIASTEYNISKSQFLTEASDAFSFAASTKSAKVKNMASELQSMLSGNGSIDAMKPKLEALQKEVARLENEKAKQLAKKQKEALAGALGGLDESAYTAERKAKALSFASMEKADEYYRDTAGSVWRTTTEEGRKGLYEYTAGSGAMNWTLRGWDRGSYGLTAPSKWTKLADDEALKKLQTMKGTYTGEPLDVLVGAAEKAIGMSRYADDVWLARGGSYMELDGLLGFPFGTVEKLVYSSDDAGLKKLVGQIGLEKGFTSTGAMGGTGFGGSVSFKMYAPKGTEMIYAEPFSHYGKGKKLSWNGKTKQTSFGYEFEMLINTNYYKRISSIKRVGSRLEVEIEILNRAVKAK